MSLARLKIRPDTIKPLQNGHPWIFQTGVEQRLPAGTPVLLCTPKGKSIGFGLAEHGPIAVRVLGKNPDKVPDLLRRRIHLAADVRKRLLTNNTNAFRLINGPGDGLPGLVVDIYDDLAIVRLYGKCWERHLDGILDALESVEYIRNIYRRFGVRNVDGKTGGEVLSGREPTDEKIIVENDLRFLVRPKTGQKTGFFLDQRENRAFIGKRSANLRVANLFSYTGGFSVYAAAGGAKHVVSVDIAPQAIADAKENFKLNDLSVSEHDFQVADAFHWKTKQNLDFLICDPPSLSHSKKSDNNAFNAYKDLAFQNGKQLSKGGLLATASCTARLTRKSWEKAVTEGIRKTGGWSWLWHASDPPDHPVSVVHPEGRYLKFSMLYRMR